MGPVFLAVHEIVPLAAQFNYPQYFLTRLTLRGIARVSRIVLAVLESGFGTGIHGMDRIGDELPFQPDGVWLRVLRQECLIKQAWSPLLPSPIPQAPPGDLAMGSASPTTQL